jgi:hypothetical protein
MPYGAEKTSRDPRSSFDPVALDLAQSIPDLTAVDKSQVFALRLIRRKFAENPTDLIRCKFSIDTEIRDKMAVVSASTISKP